MPDKPNSFLDKITDSPDEGNAVDLICLDFSEALDEVPHGKHLVKQEEMCFCVRVVRNGEKGRQQQLVKGEA